jgi:type IV pilus assembly protein PilW
MTHIDLTAHSRTRGHTLVELVVATALGLLVTAAVVSLYASQRDIAAHLDATRRLSDAGQQALEAIAAHARLAGLIAADRFAASEPHVAIAPPAIFGCANAQATGTIDEDACDAARSDSDSVAFRYVADTVSTWASADGNPTDCLGQNVLDGTIVVRFFAQANAPTRPPELYCRGNGKATPQPLVEGVERVQFGYWLPGATAPVRASAVSRDDWSRIAAVDICVVVRGSRALRRVPYVDCDGNSVTPDDQRMRAAFMRRVALRNLGAPDSSV